MTDFSEKVIVWIENTVAFITATLRVSLALISVFAPAQDWKPMIN